MPLGEAIEICVNELLKSSQTLPDLNKQQDLELLSLPTKEKVILFDQKYYRQIDEVTMGSPLAPTLANIFQCHQETAQLNTVRKPSN